MKILILGDDGRAHAFTWKLFSSPVADLLATPGNGGIGQLAPLVELDLTDAAGMSRWAFEEGVDLIVPAGIEPLAAGLVEEVVSVQIGVCGPPSRSTVMAQGVVEAKEFLLKHTIATPRGRPFRDLATAEKYLATLPLPVMLRSDQPELQELVFTERYAALEALRAVFNPGPVERTSPGVVIEEAVTGVPVSFSVITDGTTALPLLPVRIYDRLSSDLDSPLAPGMGAHTSTSVYAEKLRGYLHQYFIQPILKALAKDKLPYWGFLGVDCIITTNGPLVMGLRSTLRDMEAQVVLPRLEDDLVPIIQAAIARRLDQLPPLRWRDEASVGLSLVAHGYPKHYAMGGFINGLPDLEQGVLAFHHQTHNPGSLRHNPTRQVSNPLAELIMGRPTVGGISTTGGHVLTIVALGATLQGARGKALVNAERISFNGRSYRHDIGENDFR
jgi:phosphoribosylamine---glycine ligase